MKPPPPSPGPPPKSIGLGALAAAAAHMLTRASGLVRDIVFVAFFGAGGAADAYFAAFRVPNLFRELLAEGTLANIFVPLFAETSQKESLDNAWRLANALLGILLLILGLLTLLIFFFADPLVMLIASGFDAETHALAAHLTRIFSPFLAGISIAALFSGMLNVRGKFFLPTLAPAVLNVAVIIGCLLGDRLEAATGWAPISAVAIAASASGLLTALVQYPALRRAGFRFRPVLQKHPALAQVGRFVGAALVSVVVVQFNLLVELQMASHLEGSGQITWLMMAFRLVQLPMSVVAGSVAVAAMAKISIELAREDWPQAKQTLSRAIEMTSVLVLPAAAGLFILAEPLVQLLFERGEFTAADTAGTAGVLRMYAVAVVGICLYRVLLPVFFALKDPYLPMKLSLGVMVAKVPLAWGLVYGLQMGIDGLPLSHAITVSAEVLAMVWVLRTRMSGLASGIGAQHLRMVGATAIMAVAVMGVQPTLSALGPLGVLGSCAVGGLVYGTSGLVLGIHTAHELRAKILGKLRRGSRP
jgi:putative peptidoglycan lipid II flippase